MVDWFSVIISFCDIIVGEISVDENLWSRLKREAARIASAPTKR
jgi:hypothetical protein